MSQSLTPVSKFLVSFFKKNSFSEYWALFFCRAVLPTQDIDVPVATSNCNAKLHVKLTSDVNQCGGTGQGQLREEGIRTSTAYHV